MATESSPARDGAQPGAWLPGWAVPLAFAAFVAGVIALGIALHLQGQRAAEQIASETLRVTSELSAHSLDTWLTERSGDAEAIGSNPLLVKALDHWWQGDAQRA